FKLIIYCRKSSADHSALVKITISINCYTNSYYTRRRKGNHETGDGIMDLMQKLNILADSAKYDVACTSSGVQRKGNGSGIGSTAAQGICHAFSADGRCISLLKVLLTNFC